MIEPTDEALDAFVRAAGFNGRENTESAARAVARFALSRATVGRYWLFAGPNYYASGGMADFVGKFDTLPDAVTAGDAHNEAEYSNWWHVLDTTIMKVAAVRQGAYTGFIDAEMLA